MPNNNKITIDVALAAKQLQSGGLVAFPTETVYGLGANAKDPDAIAKVFKAKGRPYDHPLILHIGSALELPLWAKDIPDAAWILAQQFWPGPLTLILKKQPAVSSLITGGQDTIGIRIPNHPLTLQLLQTFNGAIVGPSANKYGRVSPTCAQHVASDLSDVEVLILDGGASMVGIESTIVDLTGQNPIIRRLGAISASQLSKTIGMNVSTQINTNPAVSTPGSSEIHYAPRTPSKLLAFDELISLAQTLQHQGHSFSVLSFANKPEFLCSIIVWQTLEENAQAYAHDLYANLRQHDALNNAYILIERPPQRQEWAPILDRLMRATFAG